MHTGLLIVTGMLAHSRGRRRLVFPAALAAALLWGSAAGAADCLAYLAAQGRYEEAMKEARGAYDENVRLPIFEASVERREAQTRMIEWYDAQKRLWKAPGKTVDQRTKEWAKKKYFAGIEAADKVFDEFVATLEPHGTAYEDALAQAAASLEDALVEIYAAAHDTSGYGRETVVKAAAAEFRKHCRE